MQTSLIVGLWRARAVWRCEVHIAGACMEEGATREQQGNKQQDNHARFRGKRRGKRMGAGDGGDGGRGNFRVYRVLVYR